MHTSNPVISVRLAIPDSAPYTQLFPSNDRWGPRLLCRLLRNRIEAAGITVNSHDYAFPLNSSFYLFTVTQKPAGPALAAVQEELTATGLLAWAQIAWRDHEELVWRLYHPESGIFSVPSKEEFDAESRKVSEAEDAARKLEQSEDESSGQ